MRYDQLAIGFEPAHGDRYTVRVLSSPAGQGSGALELPLAIEKLAPFLGRLERALGSAAVQEPAGSARDLEAAAADAAVSARELGDALFRALFPPPVLSLLDRSLGPVEAEEERGLRIALHLDPSNPGLAQLASLPWEILYRRDRREFLGLGRKTSLVRSFAVPRPERPPRLAGPLRILVATACPEGLAPLRLDEELRRVSSAGCPAAASCTLLPHTSVAALRETLLAAPFHVLHFMGHGGFDPASGEGVLWFEDDSGRAAPITGLVCAEMLRDFTSLRLVLLNACNTGRTRRQGGLDPFSGVAAALVMAGLPAVLAMQFPISDDAAIAFSESFYRRLAAGDTVDAAAVEGRMSLYLRRPGSLEWVTPALFLRAGEGRLFEAAAAGSSRPELRRRLVDFTSFIAEKTRGFVGRHWVLAEFERFAAANRCGYFLLCGDPGVGKTALLAEMSKRAATVHHFNIRAEGIQRPEQFLANVCAQLVLTFDLDDPDLPASAMQDSRFLRALLDRVSARLQPGQRAVLLVDALDEVDPAATPPGVNALFLPITLPDGIYVWVTGRRGELRLRIDCAQQPFELAQDSALNLADVRELLRERAAAPGLRSHLLERGISEEAFIADMADKSEGNFMYLRFVLPEIESGAYRGGGTGGLPQGLRGYYEDHWRRMRASDEATWLSDQVPVLSALTVVREPVSLALIASFAGIADQRRVQAVLSRWEQFLYISESRDGEAPRKRYRLYHSSFQDFIAKKDEVAGEHVHLERAHRLIADVLLQELGET